MKKSIQLLASTLLALTGWNGLAEAAGSSFYGVISGLEVGSSGIYVTIDQNYIDSFPCSPKAGKHIAYYFLRAGSYLNNDDGKQFQINNLANTLQIAAANGSYVRIWGTGTCLQSKRGYQFEYISSARINSPFINWTEPKPVARSGPRSADVASPFEHDSNEPDAEPAE
jgi:hypothetical protein